MSVFAFDGGRPKLTHGGTYNANPVTMVAGRKAMELLTPDALDRLNGLGHRMREGLAECLSVAGRAGQVKGQGSLALLSLSDRPFENNRELAYAAAFAEQQAALQRTLLNSGVFIAPSLAFTLSTAMDERDIDFALEQVLAALRAL
jgi:glutamate-1-semialdehyde 2,1-aminomutase